MTWLGGWRPNVVLSIWCVLCGAAVAQTIEVEGVRLGNTAVVNEQRLQLNGAGVSKRGYYKAYVTSLYLPEKRDSLDAIAKLPGPKRLQLNILRELSGATISRYFINDFRLAATDAEFRSLINEVTSVGALYSTLAKVSEGDVFWIDFIPGKGAIVQRNGIAIVQADFKPYLNTPGSELMFQILLRMYAGKDQPEELQKNLMGLSTSMQTVVAAEAPARPVRKEPALPSAAPTAAAPSVAAPPVTAATGTGAGDTGAAAEPAVASPSPLPKAAAVAVPTVPLTSVAPDLVRRAPEAARPVSAASSAPRPPRVSTGARGARPNGPGSSAQQRIAPQPAAPRSLAIPAAASASASQ
jgi:hypothetical protein